MKIHAIAATAQARECLMAYFDEVVALRKAGDLEDVGHYASRWCEQAARLALVLHGGLHGLEAHQHPLALETAESAVTLAKWFAEQQLGLLAKSRHACAAKIETEVLELLESNRERKSVDFITVRDVQRARIAPNAERARALLGRLEQDGVLVGQDVTPPGGGKITRIFRRTTNPVPE